jgi:hypothetical protein
VCRRTRPGADQHRRAAGQTAPPPTAVQSPNPPPGQTPSPSATDSNMGAGRQHDRPHRDRRQHRHQRRHDLRHPLGFDVRHDSGATTGTMGTTDTSRAPRTATQLRTPYGRPVRRGGRGAFAFVLAFAASRCADGFSGRPPAPPPRARSAAAVPAATGPSGRTQRPACAVPAAR